MPRTNPDKKATKHNIVYTTKNFLAFSLSKSTDVNNATQITSTKENTALCMPISLNTAMQNNKYTTIGKNLLKLTFFFTSNLIRMDTRNIKVKILYNDTPRNTPYSSL